MLVTTSDLSYCMRCRKWRPFRKDMPSSLLRVSDTKQSSADRLWLQMEDSVHCHREKQQGFTSLHSAVSHSVNEVGNQVFKWWFARCFYRTQADACGSRAIEWFIRLAHRCWSPLPTYRIVCDAGSDNPLGRIYHPVCSVSVTPSKARLNGFCYKWKIQSIATERYSRDSLYSAVSHSAIYPFLRWLKSQVYHLLYSALKCFQVTHYFVLR